MVKFWKEHGALRLILMLIFFAAGLALLFFGWMQTGKLWGLGVMIVGLAMLLFVLWLYNIVFTEPKDRSLKKK